MEMEVDVCVIGAGPGGYMAALKTARKGLKTVLIEKEFLGGTCLNVGCIPTKTLVSSAESYTSFKDAENFGVDLDPSLIKINWEKVQKRKENIIQKLRTGVTGLLMNAKVEFIIGAASFIDPHRISVTEKGQEDLTIKADKFIIATGSEPAMPSFVPKSPRVLDSTGILNLAKIPKSLIIVGGGVIGCEFASIFAQIGTSVTIVELMNEILPGQDSAISSQLTREFKKAKIQIFNGKPIQNITTDENKVKAIVGDREIESEYMLVSIGRKPVTKELNLEVTGVEVASNGYITVNERSRTNVPHIYAIGDVTGRIQLAHMATAMGICAANNISGKIDTFRDNIIPSCIFTHPEIGSVGVTEQFCNENDISIKIGKFPFSALGKAVVLNKNSGFCKIITEVATDKIIGVHIIGAQATDLISEAVTGMELGMTTAQLQKAVHAHPTLGEAIVEAAHAVYDECLSIPLLRK